MADDFAPPSAFASNPTSGDAQRLGIDTIRIEANALEQLALAMQDTGLGIAFAEATRILLAATGRVVVSGMGKSGLIGRKISATFASTGTPSFFIHAADAGHGDLGMIAGGDVMVLLSWSGESLELSDMITYCRRFGIPIIALTSRADGSLAKQCDVLLLMPIVPEACPNQITPTSSTVMQLALGDSLAIALVGLRGFSAEDFRIFHPRGKLASQLIRVADIMTTGDAMPRVGKGATVLEAAIEISHRRLGITAVVDEDGKLVGAFTDGDLRRTVAAHDVNASVEQHMSLRPKRIHAGALASEALAIMNGQNISQLFICDGDQVDGVVHLHDILRAGVA